LSKSLKTHFSISAQYIYTFERQIYLFQHIEQFKMGEWKVIICHRKNFDDTEINQLSLFDEKK